MNKGSTYWLKETRNTDDNFDLIELANTQRAISNFVKIQTGKDIPVEFSANDDGDSMTDGTKIVISSTINTHNLDSVVGTALHESAHCIYTDFFVLKKIANRLLETNLMGGRRWIEMLLNFVEDRRIDNLVYHNAPGYQDYYRAMYDRYFYSKIIDRGLKGKEYREENWDSYAFRIINLFNKNTDLKALACLEEVHSIIDLKTIGRLTSTKHSLDVAIEVYEVLNKYFSMQKREGNQHQEQENRKGAKSNGPSKEEIKKGIW